MSQCDILIKLGGSILDHEALTAALVPELLAQRSRQRIVVLTGGGRTVKRIKANQRSQGSSFYDCWKAGVLCLEVNANLLASYSSAFGIAHCAADMASCFARRKCAVFVPTAAILGSLHLVPDWTVTTDSMGLYFASLLGARRYIIVSDVNGIHAQRPEESFHQPPLQRVTPEDLETLPTSKLDPSFPDYFRRYALPTLIINGHHPDRLSAALRGEPTVGTEVMIRAGGRERATLA